ncbi:MAG: 50S ribosomal protein L24 [Gammaproteobacteria bacterium]|nr:MAG: 50S ribosomal protein L24 [Gammaproteobacteria bacterium]
MQKIKKGDEVIVITGKNKAATGTVVKMLREVNKLVVENVNIVKKHQKGNPNEGTPGGIVEKEMPLDISNVALVNPTTGKADRVGIKTLEDGKKVRYFKSNGEVLDA